MKTISSLAILLGLCASVGAEEPRTTAANKSINGTWTVLSAEKDGKPMGEAKDIVVTVADNVFTVRDKDGKEMHLRMEFTGPGKANVTEDLSSTTGDKPVKDEKAPGAKSAVYVMTADYLAICVHHEAAEGGVKAASVSEVTGKPSGKSFCSFVLKRADAERK